MADRQMRIFYSYSSKDEKLRDRLESHLSMLRHQGLIENWHDRRIMPGEILDREISLHLETADAILFLVSEDFLASEYCYCVEAKRARERHAAQEAIVIPVILRAVDWKNEWFGRYKALPNHGKPVTSWRVREEALKDIADGVRWITERHAESPPFEELRASPPANWIVAAIERASWR